MNDFRINDLLTPVVRRFNKGFQQFIETIEARMNLDDFDKKKLKSHFCTDEVTGLIKKAVLLNESDTGTLKIEIMPKSNGDFDIIFTSVNDKGEEALEKKIMSKDISVPLFLFNHEYNQIREFLFAKEIVT